MKDFKQNTRSRFMRGPVALILMGALAIVVVQATLGMFVKNREAIKAKNEAEGRLLELEEKKSELGAELEHLNSEEGAEEAVRERFGVTKENEGLVIITDGNQEADAHEATEKTGFSFFKNWFKKIGK